MSKEVTNQKIGPVFIVGCGRTGSRLLMDSLNNHSQISISNESHILSKWKKGVESKLKKFKPLSDDDNVKRAIDFLYEETPGNYWHNIPVKKEIFLEKFLETDRSMKSLVYLVMKLQAEKDDKEIMGAKFLAHFSYVPTLFKWFPNAKIIQLFRDPRAIFVSHMKKGKYSHYPLSKENPLHSFGIFIYTTINWAWSAKLHYSYKDSFPTNRYTHLNLKT